MDVTPKYHSVIDITKIPSFHIPFLKMSILINCSISVCVKAQSFKHTLHNISIQSPLFTTTVLGLCANLHKYIASNSINAMIHIALDFVRINVSLYDLTVFINIDIENR